MPLKPQWCKKIFDVSSSYISVTTESFNNLKIYFKDIEFYAENTFQTITDLLLDFDYVRTLEFENCTFNFWFYDSKKSLFFKNCTFNDTITYNAKQTLSYQSIVSVLMFENCIFNSKVNIDNIKVGMDNTLANKSISNFIKILKAHKITDYATELENLYFNNMDTTKSKAEFDIAIQSNWLNLKQTAAFLGLSYATLLAMRKEDKASGVIRIPYVGEGKSTRYFVPLLKAYKDRDIKRVNELSKEMEKKYEKYPSK